MKAVVNLDIRNSLPNSIDKLQLAASKINKLSFDAPITFSGLAKFAKRWIVRSGKLRQTRVIRCLF